jgi:alpha-D-ribose 1-methylphosphonate 5-triphosphate diphosphatase PhnM
MSATTHCCYRHRRGIWLASCDDCTAWHLADAVARRGEMAGAPVAPVLAAPRRAPAGEWLGQTVRPAA